MSAEFNDGKKQEPRCNCDNRARDGSFPLLLAHLPDCPHFGGQLRELIEALVRGMESWAADEDGIHDAVWDAYAEAKAALGDQVTREDRGVSVE